MIIGPFFLSFASPFFILLALTLLLALWHSRRKHKKFAPQSAGAIQKKLRRKNLMIFVQALIYFFSALALLTFFFAALNPLLIEKTTKSISARRILAEVDVSGSMTIGFDAESSPLPSYENTRLVRAGVFLQKLVEMRKGDSFGIVFFDNEQYASRDFTQDQSQITEVLTPLNLIRAFSLENILKTVPEAIRLKEHAEHKGTWAMQGIEFAKNFIVSHKDWSGNETLIYIGDLELQSGGIDAGIPQKLAEIQEKYGIKGYAVFIAGDYNTSRSAEATTLITQAKMDVFKESGIPFYIIEDKESIEVIAAKIARDISPSLIETKITIKKTVAPWALMSGFMLLFFVLILNEKFPRIP